MRAASLLAFALLVSCKEAPPTLKGGPSPTPSAAPSEDESAGMSKPPMPIDGAIATEMPGEKFPLTDAQIAKMVNPTNATEYTGPTGIIEGTITVKGDPPAMKSFMALPKECEASAKAIYAPTYRAGPKNELADALVAVIGVSGYVRPSREDKVVTIKDCAIEPTVIDLNFGQRLMVGNEDATPYMPQIPVKMIVRRLALKGMSPVPLLLTQTGVIGMTWLAGAMPGTDVPTATVFVLPSALHTVTKLDGKFRITGVPVGKARVSAAHIGMDEVIKDVTVEAGKEHKVDLVMTYRNVAAPAPSASTKPSSSVKPIH